MGEVVEAQPWLPSTFIDTFDTWDTKKWKIWEFGSGFSTTWFAERVDTLWTMEHDRTWHESIKKACDRKGLTNVHCLFEERGKGYPNKITSFQDGFFDFVLVDGRDRVECFLKAFPKVSKVIALDNGYRDRYLPVRTMMAAQPDWDCRVAKWTEIRIKNGEIVTHNLADCLLWVKKGTKLRV